MNLTSNAIALAQLNTLEGELEDEQREALISLRLAVADSFNAPLADSLYDRVRSHGYIRNLIGNVAALIELPDEPTFLVSSEVLHRSFERLGGIATESIDYVFGSQYGNVFTCDRCVPLKLEQSKVGYASGDVAFSSKSLIEREKYGSVLTLYLHMHPGSGLESNLPSRTDLDNQSRLESGNYNTIGGIFSRDGYLRFFSKELPFRPYIIGKGVKNVGDGIFKLDYTS